jgi:quinol-cytochrome oxidoreductase complex cytochrome b subunit
LSPAKPENPKPSRKEALKAFFFDRLGLDAAVALADHKRVPIHSRSLFYFLGGMALFLFGIQVITGILLALYYKPSPDQAFESVRAIVTEVDFGWLFRSIHSWSANLLIGVLFLHLLTTYIMRAYRPPREFTWLTGIALLGVFMTFGFSGYLLPWNQLAYFATSVGTAIAANVPVIGKYLLLLARGGENVTGDTLARFYALHVAILPLTALGIVGLHLYLVQKHEMSVPEDMVKKYVSAKKAPSMPFVPHFLLRDMVGWYVALGLLAALAALFPWDLGQKADPFGSAPANIKPEWYFLFMFQALKDLPPYLPSAKLPWIEGETVGILFFGFLGLMVALVPFLDRGAARGRSRRLLNFCAAVTVAFVIFMTARSLVVKPVEAQPANAAQAAASSTEGTPEKATP